MIFISNILQVDNREDKFSKKIFKYLEEAGIEYETKQLVCGDYLLPNGEIVERKTLMDFVQSYISKHLQNQCNSLDENVDRYYVFISGKYNYFEFSARNLPYITEAGISKMVLHLLQNYPKLRVVYFANDKQLIEVGIKELLNYKGAQFKETFIKKNQSEKDVFLSMLTCVPGIGLKRAVDISMVFNNIRELRTAIDTKDERLFNIKGLGDKKINELNKYI